MLALNQVKKLKKYERLKDSGVEWLGKIPEHWEVIRLRFLSKIETGSKDTQDRNPEGKYPFFVRADTIENIDEYTYDTEAVMTAGDGVGVGKVFHYFKGKFASHQRVYVFHSFKGITGKFLYYYLKANFANEVLKYTAKSTVDSLRRPMLLDFQISLPTKKEQLSITCFIESETSRLDQLITQKRRLIELLQEKRQAVILQAVTKGLNPSVPMKESGLEWLGAIPEHWEAIKSQWVCIKISDGSHYSPETKDDGYPYITVSDLGDRMIDFQNCKRISKESFDKLVRDGNKPKKLDVLLSKDGTIGKCVVNNFDQDFVVLSSIGILRPNLKLIDPYFLRYYLISSSSLDQMYSLTHGAALTRLTVEIMQRMIIVIPNLNDQRDIIRFLDQETSKLGQLIVNLTGQIRLLEEYRQVLITNTVTGGIDVRGEND